MKRELRHIHPWSAVRVCFFVGLLCGFLLGLFNGVILKYFAGVLGEQAIPRDMMNAMNLSGGTIIALAIILSLISSLLLAVFGGIAAIFYNLIAAWFGGLEVTLTGDDSSSGSDLPKDEHNHGKQNDE
jgi:Transmembrane domain of unknown function (DUF3566)